MKKLVILLLVVCTSCEEIIEVPNISDKTLTLVSPSDGVSLNSGNSIFFDWETIEDAEVYHIQIANPTFVEANQIVADSILTGTSFQTTLDADIYQWRVRAENIGYETQYTTQGFIVED